MMRDYRRRLILVATANNKTREEKIYGPMKNCARAFL
jgi:hypothetical protein